MKLLFRLISMMIVVVIASSACTNKQNETSKPKATIDVPEYMSYGQLPADYSLEHAKTDDCVVFEDLQLTSGTEVWEKFIDCTKKGEKAKIRLAYYYTLEKQNVSEEYYEEEKQNYPALYIMDLSFDGEDYHLNETIDKQATEHIYPYLVKYSGTPSSDTAIYSRYVTYILVRDQNITYEQIEHGLYSSQSNDLVDCIPVYTDLIR